MQALRHLLNGTERARADRFRFAEDYNAYVSAHALLRMMLTEASGIPADEWQFLEMPKGKPYIHPSLGRPDLQFSLSHSRGMVACAVGQTHEVGVDVEAYCQTIPVIEMAQLLFAASEVELIKKLEPPAQISMFYRLWTLKEAHAKATGLGFAVPFDDVVFSPVNSAGTLSPDGLDDVKAWQFHEFEPDLHSRVALAVRRRADQPIKLDAAALSLQDCLEGARRIKHHSTATLSTLR